MRTRNAFLHFIRDTKRMRTFIIGVVFIILLGLLIYFIPPKNALCVAGFFALLFFATFFLSCSLLNGVQHGTIIGGGVTVYFFLRFLELHHPLYLILIITTIISLELYVRKRQSL